ncbi:MAG: hypothetical protein L0Z50_37045, partial [Verrucomicrobiales bacterium]|nr:hypothetical protein [Verrucomicrobiales bacterium]
IMLSGLFLPETEAQRRNRDEILRHASCQSLSFNMHGIEMKDRSTGFLQRNCFGHQSIEAHK